MLIAIKDVFKRRFFLKKGHTKGKKKGPKAAGAVKEHMAYFCQINATPDKTGKSKEYKTVFFEFTEDWDDKHPLRVLKDFQGHLQSDTYIGFKKAGEQFEHVIGLECWSRAKRKYH